MEEFEYGGSAGKATRKSLNREKRSHKAQTAPTGVRYNTLRAGESLAAKLAFASVKRPSGGNRRRHH